MIIASFVFDSSVSASFLGGTGANNLDGSFVTKSGCYEDFEASKIKRERFVALKRICWASYAILGYTAATFMATPLTPGPIDENLNSIITNDRLASDTRSWELVNSFQSMSRKSAAEKLRNLFDVYHRDYVNASREVQRARRKLQACEQGRSGVVNKKRKLDDRYDKSIDYPLQYTAEGPEPIVVESLGDSPMTFEGPFRNRRRGGKAMLRLDDSGDTFQLRGPFDGSSTLLPATLRESRSMPVLNLGASHTDTTMTSTNQSLRPDTRSESTRTVYSLLQGTYTG